ncbi:MAG: MBL fold metallo-hydrolase [Saprospiraceae bacterium]|nr:MBL fold metallo-hydrolase [Saprospiraceae bacterium]
MKIQYRNDGITVFESALYRTTCTVISLAQSVLIVDPNWLPDEIDFIADYVQQHYSGYTQYLLFTHSDYDHIIGYGRFPNAKVIASEKLTSNPRKQEILKQIEDFDNEYYITRNYPLAYPAVNYSILTDVQTLTIENTQLIFYLAPGHVTDGLFILIPSKNCWIAGDYLSNIEIPFVDDNLNDYILTLTKAQSILDQYKEITILITGHGDLAVSRMEIQNRITNDSFYLKSLGNKDDEKVDNIIKKYSFYPVMKMAHEKNKKII